MYSSAELVLETKWYHLQFDLPDAKAECLRAFLVEFCGDNGIKIIVSRLEYFLDESFSLYGSSSD